MASPLLHKSSHQLRIGQIFRFDIAYKPCSSAEDYAKLPPRSLWLRVRNLEPLALRAAYLAGPYSIYVDCRPLDYERNKKTFITAEQPLFEPQLHPGQTFWVELPCHVFKEEYHWSVDVVSQIIFNTSQLVNFDVCISESRDMSEVVAKANDLVVSVHDTLDLWNLPVPDTSKPIHLVILSHGLHSNVSADMLFLKEAIDNSRENVVVKGFFGNICKTERGIKYLGSRVAEYVVGLLQNEAFENANKISFVGHSLGGPVQTFAIAYLEANYPWVFQKLQPTNFITLASPMLGVAHDNPAYVKMALLAGIAGRTGHELGLQFTEKGNKPLLLLLPSGPTHRVLKRFVRRTVYANAFNDGIVPLRTSALLYLDYQGLSTLLGPQTGQPGDDPKLSAKIPRDLPDAQDSQSLVLLAVMSYFMPQKHSHDESERKLKNEDEEALVEERYLKLPKPLMLESAASLLLPPLPSKKYLTDPESRENVIFHDKVYTENDLPKAEKSVKEVEDEAALISSLNGVKRRSSLQSVGDAERKGMIKMIASKGEEIRLVILGNMTEQLEEAIAREYHKLMLWRKVLVRLKPDAHNNIVVRRRFSNAYGWPIVDHLVENHFDVDLPDELQLTKEDSLDTGPDGAELSKILSVDVIRRENEELDKVPVENAEDTWTQFNDKVDTFDGPAGIFCDISERVLKMKNDWNTVGLKAFLPQYKEEQVTESPTTEEAPKGLMGDFI
ncbi:hypothetical protein PUMCH_001701 [Australozyma saopauloensis]|uniref:DUF676 domain-containing protein n=1 Tax=Australozyma saopauloensis TaxID=291208 RepID=A0AAX4H7H9_9ASCO|nr:hypothetical protein PUMCH_001701 [[Candida] saopauloensis]